MDWQQWITLLIAVAATGYLVRRGWAVIRGRRAGCADCHQCDASTDRVPPQKRLYTLPANRRSES